MPKSIKKFKVGMRITPRNKMDTGDYSYVLSEPVGKITHKDFKPYYTPGEMLKMGVFEGKYLNDCRNEFPLEWYSEAKAAGKLSLVADVNCNYFKIKSRMSLGDWRRKGWIPIVPGDPDNRGWFQWYCRYYMGRRVPILDEKQIARWRSFRRHYAQVARNCETIKCRPKQRQALLQWAYKCNAVRSPLQTRSI